MKYDVSNHRHAAIYVTSRLNSEMYKTITELSGDIQLNWTVVLVPFPKHGNVIDLQLKT